MSIAFDFFTIGAPPIKKKNNFIPCKKKQTIKKVNTKQETIKNDAGKKINPTSLLKQNKTKDEKKQIPQILSNIQYNVDNFSSDSIEIKNEKNNNKTIYKKEKLNNKNEIEKKNKQNEISKEKKILQKKAEHATIQTEKISETHNIENNEKLKKDILDYTNELNKNISSENNNEKSFIKEQNVYNLESENKSSTNQNSLILLTDDNKKVNVNQRENKITIDQNKIDNNVNLSLSDNKEFGNNKSENSYENITKIISKNSQIKTEQDNKSYEYVNEELKESFTILEESKHSKNNSFIIISNDEDQNNKIMITDESKEPSQNDDIKIIGLEKFYENEEKNFPDSSFSENDKNTNTQSLDIEVIQFEKKNILEEKNKNDNQKQEFKIPKPPAVNVNNSFRRSSYPKKQKNEDKKSIEVFYGQFGLSIMSFINYKWSLMYFLSNSNNFLTSINKNIIYFTPEVKQFSILPYMTEINNEVLDILQKYEKSIRYFKKIIQYPYSKTSDNLENLDTRILPLMKPINKLTTAEICLSIPPGIYETFARAVIDFNNYSNSNIFLQIRLLETFNDFIDSDQVYGCSKEKFYKLIRETKSITHLEGKLPENIYNEIKIEDNIPEIKYKNQIPYGISDLLWSWKINIPPKIFMSTAIHQSINHMIGVDLLTNKGKLLKGIKKFCSKDLLLVSNPLIYKNLLDIYINNKIKLPSNNNFSIKKDDLINIIPETFILPNEYTGFVNFFTEKTYKSKQNNDYTKKAITKDYYYKPIFILKPTSLSRGREISIISTLSEVSYDQHSVIQEYIHTPLLEIQGLRKVDFRVYCSIFVLPSSEFKAYIYNNGLARYCKEKFSLDPKTYKNPTIHLTNTSINNNKKLYHSIIEEFSEGFLNFAQFQKKNILMDKNGWVHKQFELSGYNLTNKITESDTIITELTLLLGNNALITLYNNGQTQSNYTKEAIIKFMHYLLQFPIFLGISTAIYGNKNTISIESAVNEGKNRLQPFPNSFELLGGDVIFNCQCELEETVIASKKHILMKMFITSKLIEINSSPGMLLDSEADYTIKPKLLAGTMQMALHSQLISSDPNLRKTIKSNIYNLFSQQKDTNLNDNKYFNRSIQSLILEVNNYVIKMNSILFNKNSTKNKEYHEWINKISKNIKEKLKNIANDYNFTEIL